MRFSLVLATLIVGTCTLAQASELSKISNVQIQSHPEYVEFALLTDTPIDIGNVSSRREGSLMIFEFSGWTTDRRWIDTEDEVLKRVLLHQSPDANLAALRVRFVTDVTDAMLRNVRFRLEDESLIAAIPRTDEIAQRWSKTAEIATPTQDLRSDSKLSRPNETRQAEQKEAQDLPLADKKAPQDENELVFTEQVSEVANPASANEQSAGIATPDLDKGPVFLIALVLMIGTAFVLMRKVKQTKPSYQSGPMIRTVSTHMLGPKQGLLLVDVGGEMVLLGTSDKGVQLLTKLDGHSSLDTEPEQTRRSARVDETTTENPFGKMLGQFRQASEKLRAASAISRDEDRSASEELSVLAEDTPKYDRRRFKPVAPKSAVPVYAVQPALQERDTLIEKLRMLREA